MSPQNLLHVLLHRRQALSAHQDRAHLRQADSALAIHHAIKTLRHTAPEIDRQPVTRSDHIVRPGRQVHRNQLRISRRVLKHIRAKPPRRDGPGDRLHVHVVKRGNAFIGIFLTNHSRRLAKWNLGRSWVHSGTHRRTQRCEWKIFRAARSAHVRQIAARGVRSHTVGSEQPIAGAPGIRISARQDRSRQAVHSRGFGTKILRGNHIDVIEGLSGFIGTRRWKLGEPAGRISCRLRHLSAQNRIWVFAWKTGKIRLRRRSTGRLLLRPRSLPGTSRSRCACLRSIAALIQLRIALCIISRTLDSPLMNPRQFFLFLILREPSHPLLQ